MVLRRRHSGVVPGGLVVHLAVLLVGVGMASGGELSFEERLAGRRAVEAVYWQHRSGTAGGAALSSLAEALPEAVLVQRVEDSLRLSKALERSWERPITDDDLQAELDRMVAESARPDLLEELFAALDHDPVLVAECLARPLLAQRLARELYAADERLHGALRREAAAEVARAARPDDLWTLSGELHERVWLEREDGQLKGDLLAGPDGERATILDPGELAGLAEELDRGFGGRAEAGQVGPLEESPEAFWVTAVLDRGDRCLRLLTVTWRKRDFDDWWGEVRGQFPAEAPTASSGLHLGAPGAAKRTADTWTAVSSSGVPGVRANHTAVNTGVEMIVWGGEQSAGYLYGGSAYDLATGSWSAITNTNHPESRMDHTAVWTGDEMIVWGGQGISSLLNTGGRYNPTTNSWTTMPTSGAPSARRYHSMSFNTPYLPQTYVFGGWGGSSHLANGGVYTVAGGWSTLSSGGSPPSSRMSHGAGAWQAPLSPHLVVWGGEGPVGVLGDGAMLSLTSGTWSTLPASGAPAARTEPGLLVTRHPSMDKYGRIIVWGGYNGSVALNNGAVLRDRYASSWTATAAAGLTGRQGHVVIQGEEYTMIVWGGYNGASLYSSGAVYNPYNNVWRPMTSTGAPSGRKWHAAVGDEPYLYDAVIWGGYDAGGFANTGAIYEQPADFQVKGDVELPDSVPGGSEWLTQGWSVYRLGGFATAVALSCTGLSGSCSFDPNPTTAGFTWSFSISSALATGTYTFSIRGVADGLTRDWPVSVTVRNFGLSCDGLSATPGETVITSCQVSSSNAFNDPVSLHCDSPGCSFSPASVTPPGNGVATSTLTFIASATPGSHTQEVSASSHNAYRLFDVPYTVDAALVFADNFESGTTSAWSSVTP